MKIAVPLRSKSRLLGEVFRLMLSNEDERLTPTEAERGQELYINYRQLSYGYAELVLRRNGFPVKLLNGLKNKVDERACMRVLRQTRGVATRID